MCDVSYQLPIGCPDTFLYPGTGCMQRMNKTRNTCTTLTNAASTVVVSKSDIVYNIYIIHVWQTGAVVIY